MYKNNGETKESSCVNDDDTKDQRILLLNTNCIRLQVSNQISSE